MYKISIWISLSSCLIEVISSMSCGIDNSPTSHVYEGISRVEVYPWLGILYYPYGNKKFTTAVVLVTRQIVLASAAEVDKLPKEDFRARARVVVGYNCSGPSIGIRDYSYHHDYARETFSTLAMIQLETDLVSIELRPICPPPSHFKDQHFFAMVLSENCKRSRVRVHKMKYVSPENCQAYYRRTGLDVEKMWPSHTACARSVSGGRCVWRSGAILVVKVGRRWRLLGFGMYGPGCQAPARFLDYGMYHGWVQRSVQRIGRPAITTLGKNHIVLRRSLGNVQRYGKCDMEETKRELYTDYTTITNEKGVVRYNVTIIGDVEYSCVVFKAEYAQITNEVPQIRLRRWCAGQLGMCFGGFQYAEIYFHVEITFSYMVSFNVMAYGKEATVIDPKRSLRYLNRFMEYPELFPYGQVKNRSLVMLKSEEWPWYGKR